MQVNVYVERRRSGTCMMKLSHKGESTPFIVFMLEAILDAVISAPQETPRVSPQVDRLLAVLEGEMSLRQILHALNLSDRNSFRQRYLQPALEYGYVEMTLPESPTARNQRFRLTERGRVVNRTCQNIPDIRT